MQKLIKKYKILLLKVAMFFVYVYTKRPSDEDILYMENVARKLGAKFSVAEDVGVDIKGPILLWKLGCVCGDNHRGDLEVDENISARNIGYIIEEEMENTWTCYDGSF